MQLPVLLADEATSKPQSALSLSSMGEPSDDSTTSGSTRATSPWSSSGEERDGGSWCGPPEVPFVLGSSGFPEAESGATFLIIAGL